jgi:hypothetical protein
MIIERLTDSCYFNGEYAAVIVETQTGELKWAIIGPKDKVHVLALYDEDDRLTALEDLKGRM